MELHDNLHLQDTRQDDDLFVNLSWSPSGTALGHSVMPTLFDI